MESQVCLVTGANSGLGKATALGLAKLKATAVMVCRDRARGEAAQAEIRADSGNPNVELMLADLSSQASIRSLAESIRARHPRLNVLVNNAGVALRKRTMTAEGIETVFAVNYLAPFLLTNLLLDILKANAPARVVNVAGDFHRKAAIHFGDLMFEKGYSGFRANNQAKLALILFTYELARRLEGTGVTVNCLHPGAVRTDGPLKDPDLSPLSRFLYRTVRPFFLSPEKGAQTAIYLASSPEVEGVTGRYFIKKKPVKSSPESYDTDIARRLWDASAGLTNLNTIIL
jgi:NAD(P)-dependent dehydrogenase (short-subunit alcohol dehydrogenase family)